MRPLAPLALALLVSACARSEAPAPPRAGSPPRSEASLLGEGDERLVERAVDGDTVVLAGGERIRVLGINALEMKHPDPRVHELAVQAQGVLARAVEGRRARVVVGMPLEPRDKYGRLLAYLEIPGEAEPDVGAHLIAEGLARPYPSAHPRAERYRSLAFAARSRHVGLWQADVARVMKLEPEADIACGDAAANIGRLVRLRGKLEPGRRSDRVHVAKLNDGSGTLDIVIFPSRYDEIPLDLVRQWQHGTLSVIGEISLHDGRPQIILDDPFQAEPGPAE